MPSTVRNIRLKNGIFQKRQGSAPRHISGYLTLSQVAQQLGVTPNAIHYHIKKERIQVDKDPKTGPYLFPDKPETLELFKRFRAGELHSLHFSTEYQDD